MLSFRVVSLILCCGANYFNIICTAKPGSFQICILTNITAKVVLPYSEWKMTTKFGILHAIMADHAKKQRKVIATKPYISIIEQWVYFSRAQPFAIKWSRSKVSKSQLVVYHKHTRTTKCLLGIIDRAFMYAPRKMLV